MIVPTVENSVLAVVDLQQKLMPVISGGENIINRTALLLQGADKLGLDVLVSEQYPKGLGNTVPELATWLSENTPVIAKTSFSVFGSEEFCAELGKRKRDVLIFCGIESHVCLLQSVLDARERGYEVIVASDAVMSRKFSDCHAALEMMRSMGVSVVSTESILFMLLRNAAHPAFKAISKLVK